MTNYMIEFVKRKTSKGHLYVVHEKSECNNLNSFSIGKRKTCHVASVIRKIEWLF